MSICIGRVLLFFFQAEDGIRDLVRSRGLGDVYKRQRIDIAQDAGCFASLALLRGRGVLQIFGASAIHVLSLIHI